MDKISFEAWNERMAENWDFEEYYNTSNPIVKYLEKIRTSWILRLACPKDDEKIIEIGCGAGHVLEKINKGIMYGIDLSKRLISIAHDRLGSRVELKRCSAEDIEYPDNFFDKIICADIIEHVENPKKVLEEIRRIGKHDTLVIISVPNDKIICRIRDLLVRLGVFKLLFKKVPDARWNWHLHVFDESMLNNLTGGVLEKIQLKALPSRLLPLRYVGSYKIIK